MLDSGESNTALASSRLCPLKPSHSSTRALLSLALTLKMNQIPASTENLDWDARLHVQRLDQDQLKALIGAILERGGFTTGIDPLLLPVSPLLSLHFSLVFPIL